MVQLREKMGVTLLVAYASIGLSQVTSLLYFFLVFRILPIEEVGVYSWAIAIATLYTYVIDLGLVTFLVGELSSAPYSLRQVALVVLIVRAPFVALGWLAVQAWAWVTGPSTLEYGVLAFVTLSYIMQLFELGIVSWLQIRQRQNAVNILGLTMPVGRLLGIVLLLWLGHNVTLWDVAWLAIITQAVSTLCFVLLAARAVCDPRPIGGTPRGVRHLLRQFSQRGPKLTIMYLLMALQSRLDWLLVSILLSKVALANFALANKVLEFAMLLAGIGARTTFPWLSRPDVHGPHLKARLMLGRRVFAVSSVILCAGLFFWSPALLKLFFADKYAGAEGAMRLMILFGGIFMVNQYNFYWLLANKLEKEYTGFILLATLLQIGVDVALMPRLGITGAAIGMLVMGAVLHLGQVGLLLHQGMLEIWEVVGLETFLLTSTIIVAVLWVVSPLLVLNTVVSWLAIVGLGSFLVLGRDDRSQILLRTRQMLIAVISYFTKLFCSEG